MGKRLRSLVGSMAAVAALACSPQVSQAQALIPAEVLTLKNGFRAILHVDKRQPVVHVFMHYNIGSRDESPTRTGLAHLFEHLMFRGSEHLDTRSQSGYLFRMGAFGVNATTSMDETVYFETVPSFNLEPILWMEADRLGFPKISNSDLKEERNIVKNERRQRYETTPYGAAREEGRKALFPAAHPYHHLTIGDQAHLDAVTLDEARAFFARYYEPRNVTLLLVGDLEAEPTKALIKKYFETLPAARESGPVMKAGDTPPVVLSAERKLEISEAVGKQPWLQLMWPTPHQCAEQHAVAEVLTALLQRSDRGRLGKNRLQLDADTSITVRRQSLALQSIFMVDVISDKLASLEEARLRIDQELADLAQKEPTGEELTAAKRSLRNNFLSQLQSVSAKAELLLRSAQCYGSPLLSAQLLDRTERVTAAEVTEFVKKYLQPTQRVRTLAIPTTAKGGAK
jgi:zinc protease